jgi:hypothetical protein
LISVDVAVFLLFKNLGNGKEDATFFDVAKFIVDSSAKHAHRGRKAHVGVNKRRYIDATVANFGVEDALIFFEVVAGEDSLHGLGVEVGLERVNGGNEVVVVGEMLVEEV